MKPRLLPILFSTLMVQAILEGRKTQTRRIVKPQPVLENGFWNLFGAAWAEGMNNVPVMDGYSLWKNAKYKVGDILWVREEHYVYGHWERRSDLTKSGKHRWRFVNDNSHPILFSDCKPQDYRISRDTLNPYNPQYYKRNGRVMFRHYARIFLRVTNVRVEHLQAISEDDCKAEGIKYHQLPTSDFVYWDYLKEKWLSYNPESCRYPTARECYQSLWQSINGPGSWDANPWVWPYDFERITKEQAIEACKESPQLTLNL